MRRTVCHSHCYWLYIKVCFLCGFFANKLSSMILFARLVGWSTARQGVCGICKFMQIFISTANYFTAADDIVSHFNAKQYRATPLEPTLAGVVFIICYMCVLVCVFSLNLHACVQLFLCAKCKVQGTRLPVMCERWRHACQSISGTFKLYKFLKTILYQQKTHTHPHMATWLPKCMANQMLCAKMWGESGKSALTSHL